MKVLGIIPARYASTRFPGKPLIDIGGKSMIRRVYEQALKSRLLNRVIVATDDQRIYDHVLSFGGEITLTSDKHESGTDRCAEIALKHSDFEVIINIQGDEPFIDPAQIDLLCECFDDQKNVIATLIKNIENSADLFNHNIPKVILNKNQEAIYFSRSPVPFYRDMEKDSWLSNHTYYKHIGIYGYRKKTLKKISELQVSSLEKAEALEQLRWIENGFLIKTAVTEIENISIDTPQDLEAVLSRIDLSNY
ncbi:MAG: 3-deoxy-manno-octulosonate cytidylyltransferase [Flavobacterium sp.]|nr:3-deoxy-manno-octulosonate cytidylyltransferase [Pedobacter sp.]